MYPDIVLYFDNKNVISKNYYWNIFFPPKVGTRLDFV